MTVVICHLTRMHSRAICVAGVDTRTRRHVRPVLANESLRRPLLRGQGGVFDIGAEVDLGQTVAVGLPPEMEDRRMIATQVRYVQDVEPAAFWELLQNQAQPTLETIFGDALLLQQNTGMVPLRSGRASLGIWQPAQRPVLSLSEQGKIRLQAHEKGVSLRLPVTDLRLYEQDGETPRHALIQRVAQHLQEGAGFLLSMGLTRPWQKPGEPVAQHWLQVNNLHFEDYPLWTERASRLPF